MRLVLIFVITLLFSSCNSQDHKRPNIGESDISSEELTTVKKEGKTIEKRFFVASPLQRSQLEFSSFAYFLRTLPLKPDGSMVRLHNGKLKGDQDVAAAIIDLPVGKRDLHQCADGIMHLKARYHYQRGEYAKIGFHFVNGFYCDFEHWKNGYRVSVSGNKTNWYKATQPDSSEAKFWKYLEMVFSYAGTLSLAKELTPVAIQDLQVGDVFIVGGSPGHAIIVVDLAIDSQTKEKYFLLAQSYMPAQELHVLNNYSNKKLSPWYSLSELENQISTPEWTFDTEDLKRFDGQ